MALASSTKKWILVFAASASVCAVIQATRPDFGCLGVLAANLAVLSGLVLLYRIVRALFGLIIRRTSLRLAFSYFLIGIVPIPLALAMLAAGAYLVSHQIIAARLRREIVAAVEQAAGQKSVPQIRVVDGTVIASDVSWIRPGDRAKWADRVKDFPRPVLEGEKIWFPVASGGPADKLRLVLFTDPSTDLLQQVADRSGYEVRMGTGRSRSSQKEYTFHVGKDSEGGLAHSATPRAAPVEESSWLSQNWLYGVSVERPLAVYGGADARERIVLFIGRTSPRILFGQLFGQGVPELGRVFWAILIGLAGALLFVYLVALSIAFVLAGSIARNVNRLTRATQEVAGGNFAFRIASTSRDQIGDLARSFDGMAASMEGLLAETAEKKRMEGEIAAARTIQQKLLPPPQATLTGLSLVAHFEPADQIGGDYYDYMDMPDGRTAVAIGDVSGHGLPTGLLVAMAKAALSTQIESGLSGSALFGRLNELIHRSTDTRNYMTLALLAVDPDTRRAELTNAGQLAPYRISGGSVESLSLPSFPLGLFENKEFPTQSYSLESRDRLVLLTDGMVEAADAAGEPFGFERFEALLRTEAGASAEALRDAVLSALAAHTQSARLDDDRTLVILTIS